MCRIIFSVILFVLAIILNCGNATHKCPVPPETILVYFDMAQISSLMLHHDFTDVFQEPVKCETGNDKVCLDDQRCCGGEVGCCLAERRCGCKDIGSSTCSYPAPLAVLGKSECNADGTTGAITCLRERRLGNNYLLGKNSTQPSFIEPQKNLGDMNFDTASGEGIDVDTTPVQGDLRGSRPYTSPEFPPKKLAHHLSKATIDELIEYVTNLKLKGLPYGRPE